MCRSERLDPSDLDDAQRRLYDSITGGPRGQGPQSFSLTDDAGRLEGPFNAMLSSPELGGPLQALGSAIRYQSDLTSRAREIAILVVAHVWASEFEIYAHEALGRSVGLDETELSALRNRDALVFTDEIERLVACTALTLAERADLTDDEYEAAQEGLGDRGLFDLVTLVGYYATLALQLRIYRVAAPGQ